MRKRGELSEPAKAAGISRQQLHQRLRKGWSMEKALRGTRHRKSGEGTEGRADASRGTVISVRRATVRADECQALEKRCVAITCERSRPDRQ